MPATTGVLVVNLGTPDAPTPEAVRRFLAEFLSDPRVVDLPRIPWQVVLRAFILPFRPARSAHAYQQVWTPAGSPLLTGTEALTRALERRLAALQAEPPAVAMGMTYGNPSIATRLDSDCGRRARHGSSCCRSTRSTRRRRPPPRSIAWTPSSRDGPRRPSGS